jgi:hypothetical protein
VVEELCLLKIHLHTRQWWSRDQIMKESERLPDVPTIPPSHHTDLTLFIVNAYVFLAESQNFRVLFCAMQDRQPPIFRV